MDNIAATASTSSSTTSTTSSNENNENPIAFTDLEKEIEALSVNELAETVKKNLDYIETKIGEYSTNMKSSPTGEEIVTESKQITTTVADRTSPVLRPTKSRSNSSSSSLTSYQDLPTSLHESFNACRNRITNQLERSFEQRHEQREEATMTESFLERVDNESPNIYSSSPQQQQQQQQQPQSNNSVDNDLMSSTLRRTYASPYLDPTRQVNTADYTSSFNENYMNSKIKPDYYYSTPDKTSSNNQNHNHDHLTTTAGTTSAYSYPMCRSAFESDPEVVLLRQHRLATRMTARPQSPTTTTTAAGGQQRYVTTTTTTTTTNKNYNNDSTNRNNDDDYMGMNLFSCRLKKEASTASIGKEEYDDDDTVESTHLDSDYAKSPIFPSDAYGSRPSVHIPTGIYSNKTKMESSPNLDKIYEESRQLDPEYIRLMDQKLRKMVKKTQYESINSRSNNEAANNANRVNNGSTTTNTVTWEIPVRRDLGETKSSKDLIVAHPPPPPPTTHSSRYLPEAQVPVHELVKKVRNEVESGASVDNVPHKLNEIWMRTQLRTQTGSNVEEYFSQQVDYDPLRNLIENPARVLIESNINPQRRGLLDVGGETQSKRSPRSGENTTTTTTTTTTSVKQSPTEAAAASTNKSTCLLHERILSKKLKHENRIKNLERLIELEKSKAKKLQEMISTSGKQQQQQQQQKQHQESLSTSPPGPTDQSLSYIYESILNDEDDEDEEEEDGNCQCCSFEGGQEANNNDNRYQDRHNTSIGLNSARIVVDRSPSNERRTTTTTTTTRTTAAANESNVSEVAAATSRERKIPIVVEKKRAESWFFAVDNPKFANSHESIRRVEEVQRTTSSRPISSDQSEGGPKIYPHPYQPEGQKYWDYDPMAPHKTLQEAFNERRYDVVINSSSRVREIKAKKTRRELAKELIATSSLNHPPNSGSELNHAETEIYRSMAERLDYATKRQVVERHREWCVKNRRWAYFDELATPHAKSSMRCVNYHHHQMPPPNSSASLSQREIKERTRRKYEKLPEVQQRLLREKLEENKVKNRIKSTIFKKTIQQRVLSNGPNFNLNFKALEYSIQ